MSHQGSTAAQGTCSDRSRESLDPMDQECPAGRQIEHSCTPATTERNRTFRPGPKSSPRGDLRVGVHNRAAHAAPPPRCIRGDERHHQSIRRDDRDLRRGRDLRPLPAPVAQPNDAARAPGGRCLRTMVIGPGGIQGQAGRGRRRWAASVSASSCVSARLSPSRPRRRPSPAHWEIPVTFRGQSVPVWA